mgnify:FL=1
MKECNQCGKCCIHYSNGGLSATQDEIDWWEASRPDIYQYVLNGEIWVNPSNGEHLKRCPFLQLVDNGIDSSRKDASSSLNQPQPEKYSCSIYHDRPDDCRHYPTHIDEMVRDECEMIEVKDLLDPKSAQKKLDILMADSRPAYLGR